MGNMTNFVLIYQSKFSFQVRFTPSILIVFLKPVVPVGAVLHLLISFEALSTLETLDLMSMPSILIILLTVCASEIITINLSLNQVLSVEPQPVFAKL